MGKNQAYKAMQRAKMGTSTAAGGPGEEIDDGMVCILPPLQFATNRTEKPHYHPATNY